MQLPVNDTWIQIGGFLVGVFIGSLILLATVKNAKDIGRTSHLTLKNFPCIY